MRARAVGSWGEKQPVFAAALTVEDPRGAGKQWEMKRLSGCKKFRGKSPLVVFMCEGCDKGSWGLSISRVPEQTTLASSDGTSPGTLLLGATKGQVWLSQEDVATHTKKSRDGSSGLGTFWSMANLSTIPLDSPRPQEPRGLHDRGGFPPAQPHLQDCGNLTLQTSPPI